MRKLKPRSHDEETGIDYTLAGDYTVPAIVFPQEGDCTIGKWGAPCISGGSESAAVQPPDSDRQAAYLPC